MAFQVDVSTLPSKFSTIFTTLSFPLWLHYCSNSSSNCWQSESESLETSEDAYIPAISAAFFRTSTASSIPALTFATRFSPVPALPDTSLLHDPSTCHAKELAAIARTKTSVKSSIISKRPSKNSRSQKNGVDSEMSREMIQEEWCVFTSDTQCLQCSICEIYIQISSATSWC